MNQSVLEVCDRDLYATDRNLYAPAKDRRPASNGPLDLRLGISSKTGLCETCGESLVQCNGHFGLVKLALPAFHVGYLKMVISVLQNICKVRNLFGFKLSEANDSRIVLESFFPKRNDDPSLKTCAGQTSITYDVRKFARRSTASVAKLKPAICANPSMDGSKRPASIP